MDLEEIRDRVVERRGSTVNSQSTYIDHLINQAYKDVLSHADWPWLIERAELRLYAALMDREGTIDEDGTTITITTGSDVPAAYIGGLIQIEGYSGEYTILDVDTAEIELATPWVFTDVTVGTALRIYKPIYSLPETIDHVVDVISLEPAAWGGKLIQVPDELIDRFVTNRTDFESIGIVHWSPFGLGDGGVARIQFWPIPQAIQVAILKVKRCPPELSTGSDVPFIPVAHHHILIDGALSYAAKDDGDTQAIVAQKRQDWEIAKARLQQAAITRGTRNPTRAARWRPTGRTKHPGYWVGNQRVDG